MICYLKKKDIKIFLELNHHFIFRRQASSTNPALAALARNPELMENIPQTATLFNRMYKRTTTAPATSSNGTKLPGTKGHKKKVGL